MVKYTIKMLQRESDDLDNIYNYIADDFKEIGTAEKMVVIVTVRYTPSSFWYTIGMIILEEQEEHLYLK